MGVIVAFDFNAWKQRFPEFSNVAPATAEMYFVEASQYHRNDGGGPISSPLLQSTLLNLLTAHIAARYSQPDGSNQTANSPVGRVSSAGEGSVNASFENAYPAGTVQWFQQTKYGSDYWNMTKQFRLMQYRTARNCRGVQNPNWLYP